MRGAREVNPRRIAVLGGGIMGSCVALELARRGQRVTLIDGAPDVMQGASRWNEGKIHLGFLYAGDPSLATARRILPGGLAFCPLLAALIDHPLDAFSTDDDVYLVHRDSVADVASTKAYLHAVAELVRTATRDSGPSRYLTDVRRASVDMLSPSELADITSSDEVLAGFRVPERSVSTLPVADLIARAVRATTHLDIRTDTWIVGVQRDSAGRFDVLTADEGTADLDRFDVVVNALWEGRPAVDATMRHMPPAPWTHRFRASLFAYAPSSSLRGGVLCTGPFGDVKRYADGRYYLSWYPAGLLASGCELEPPREDAALSTARRAQITQDAVRGLARFFPAVETLVREAETVEANGGWVYAVGTGALGDPASTLHRRDKFGITVDAGYISVDTAKYSLAPWLAQQIAETALGIPRP